MQMRSAGVRRRDVSGAVNPDGAEISCVKRVGSWSDLCIYRR